MLYETEAAASFHGLCHFFGRLSKASRAGMKAALRGCPKCHFPMLEGLAHTISTRGQNGAVYVSDFAREAHQPLPAISRSLRQLEQDGLVLREADPADRRKTLVRITPEATPPVPGVKMPQRLFCLRDGPADTGAGAADECFARRTDGCHSCGKRFP